MKSIGEKWDLQDAIAYLKSRGKYIVQPGCKFSPTNAASTDVEECVRKYRAETSGSPAIVLVAGNKQNDRI